jgi:hypothetical protein
MQSIVIVALLGVGEFLSPEALERYQSANANISSGAYREAIMTLNQLASEYPRVAEIFAARCSAQVALKSNAGAEADCTYALTLKPQLATAVYALAMAQEGLGKRDAAIASYRKYAAFDEMAAPYRNTAISRAMMLEGNSALPVAYADPSSARLIVYRNHRFDGGRRMMIVLDGRLVGDISPDQYVEITSAPGDHMLELRTYPVDVFEMPHVYTLPVQLGGATVYANLDTHRGDLVLQQMPEADGRQEVRDDCTRAYARRIGADSQMAPAVAVAPVMVAPMVGVYGPGGAVTVGGYVGPHMRTECRLNSDGSNTCGYNCRLGSNGHHYCSSMPSGYCALNSNGTWSCP